MLPFLDYEVRTFQIRNSNAQSFTLGRRAFVTIGRFKRDDTGGVSVFCNYVDTLQDSSPTRITLLDVSSGGGTNPLNNGIGSHVFESGRTITIDAPDDADVDIHIFYLPSSP